MYSWVASVRSAELQKTAVKMFASFATATSLKTSFLHS